MVHLDHVMTLTPYAISCCLLQLLLLTVWYFQMARHDYLLMRMDREEAKGKAMREAGWMHCIKTIIVDDEEDDVEMANQMARGRRKQGFQCVCGCCYCFSTHCALWVLNIGVLLLLVYLLLIGWGTIESTRRYTQNPECRSATPTAIYIYVLNCALLGLYMVAVFVRCLCTARNVVQNVVALSKDLHNRVSTRKAKGKHKSAYAQVGENGHGSDDIELELDHEHDSMGMDGMDEDFLDDECEQDEFQADSIDQHAASLAPSKHAANGHKQSKAAIAQPKPSRSAVSKILAPPQPAPALDDDTREMLDMLEAKKEDNGAEADHDPNEPSMVTQANGSSTPSLQSSAPASTVSAEPVLQLVEDDVDQMEQL